MTLDQVRAVYRGSDGAATKALYERLAATGPLGEIAVNLFRTCKSSERAKVYGRRKKWRGKPSFKGAAYDRKGWSINNLCVLLENAPPALRWGWALDKIAQGNQNPHHHVIYVDLPTGQVSFHSAVRYGGPDYHHAWDRAVGTAPERICAFCADVLAGKLDLASPPPQDARAPGPDSPPRRQGDLFS